ncbi:MAG: asparagine synthase (glutamine-hydrolyzing) [Massilia sp.]
MCGISGIIDKNRRSVPQQEIREMTDLVAHRGPDGEGFYHAPGLALGHRRLAILDVSECGKQPMSYLERYVITYNGEIYNYLEIRQELAAVGYRFHSGTDTEVILAAYDRWGADCVEHFNGMWAFALHDRVRNLVFCSRDRFGVKPFYFSDQSDRFTFGSEIKQVLKGRREAAVANLDMVRDFLIEGLHDHTCSTFFAGIASLPAGHNLVFSLTDMQFQQTRWYTLVGRAPAPGQSVASLSTQFLTQLKAAIALRLRADVPVGTCLSGGLDSSSIATLAASMYHASASTPFRAVHARSLESAFDESMFARVAAQSGGIALTIVTPGADEFSAMIEEVAYAQEEPFASPSIFMQYFVFQKARESGCKVMLDGQGGDETLLGYERYFSTHLQAKEGMALARELRAINRNNAIRIRSLLAHMLYFRYAAIRMGVLRRRFGFLKNRYLRHFPNIEKMAAASRDMAALQTTEIQHFQLPHLLRYEDRNSMRHSVEARLPFLDYRMVELCLGLEPGLKIRRGWTKYILRSAMNGLMPDAITWRKSKLGFTAPADTWTASLDPAMRVTIEQSAIIAHMCKRKIDFDALDANIKWRLFSIAKWEEIFEVQLVPGKLRAPACPPLPAHAPAIAVQAIAAVHGQHQV